MFFFFKKIKSKPFFFGGVKIRYPTQHEKNRTPKGFSVVDIKKKEIGFRALSETLVDGQVGLGEVRGVGWKIFWQEAAGNPTPNQLGFRCELAVSFREVFFFC